MPAIQSLNNIPFGSLIGGPMTAAVQAQAQAAMTTIEFIERVGFDPPPTTGGTRQVKNVTFQYMKTGEMGTPSTFELTVPILSIIPIPHLRIEELNIDFTAKLNDMVDLSEQTSSQLSIGAASDAVWGWGRASLRASYSRTHNQASKSTESSEYTMNIRVRATQSEVPGGLAKILDILESAIKDVKKSSS
jgi:hypothetical protein